MRVFLGEAVWGGCLIQQPLSQIPSSLQSEGWAMLSSVVSDLTEIATVKVPLDPRLSKAKWQKSSASFFTDKVSDFGAETILLHPNQPPIPQWIEAARSCDSAIVIAPESNGLLTEIVEAFRGEGISVAAPSEQFVRLTSDKKALADWMIKASIPHPATLTKQNRSASNQAEESSRDSVTPEHSEFNSTAKKYIIKPADGCGSQGIQLFSSLQLAKAKMSEREILQPWIEGKPISLAVIVNQAGMHFLPAVSQHLDSCTLEYMGGSGPLDQHLQDRAIHLVRKVLRHLPNPESGFIGFDLILGENQAADVIIEINPRLTTSYIGLRRMVGRNLTSYILGLQSNSMPHSRLAKSIHWTSDGVLTTLTKP
ncbi:MAG: ATP-grasp domain-containing protein [Planctomycetota bacterium]|nr:ATP-grasp domain-containing protein [Planctomycetota bacterium]